MITELVITITRMVMIMRFFVDKYRAKCVCLRLDPTSVSLHERKRRGKSSRVAGAKCNVTDKDTANALIEIIVQL